jgi:CRP/FNR family transcriptional regulator, cyclic AMP receptor protein
VYVALRRKLKVTKIDAFQLRRIPLFSDATDVELTKLGKFAESVEFSERVDIIREGDFSSALLAIEEGTAEVTRGGEHVADLGPGDVFGEAGVVNDALRNATVTATSPLKLIIMGQFEVQRLRERAPEVYARIEKLAEDRGV